MIIELLIVQERLNSLVRYACLRGTSHADRASSSPDYVVTLTSTILLITLGKATSGPRNRLNSANDTNALSAVRTLALDERTKVPNVVIPT